MFQFKNFALSHEHSTLKIGTDSVLLASVVPVAGFRTVLDIGCGCGVIGCEKVPREKISRYGILKLDGGRIVDLVEKPLPEEAPSDVAIAGRYLLPTAVFGLLATQTPGKGGEIQLTDAIRRYVACADAKPLLASVYSGKRQDIGNPQGYFKALEAFNGNC